jgi:hypothetical protein
MGCCPSLSPVTEKFDRPVPIQEIPRPDSGTLEFVCSPDEADFLDDAPLLNDPPAPLSAKTIPMVQDDDNLEKLLVEVEGLSD